MHLLNHNGVYRLFNPQGNHTLGYEATQREEHCQVRSMNVPTFMNHDEGVSVFRRSVRELRSSLNLGHGGNSINKYASRENIRKSRK